MLINCIILHSYIGNDYSDDSTSFSEEENVNINIKY